MTTRLERFRHNKDLFFKNDLHSPLREDQKEDFAQLDYFPENERLVFKLRLDREGITRGPVTLDTTTGTQQPLIPAGRIHVEIEGKPVSLLLFREEGRGRYFLPFRDATTGDETYKIGRYLDPQEAPDGLITVDFNYAYNPYCAYNADWTCPIPPDENVLDVPVRAGEKSFVLDANAET